MWLPNKIIRSRDNIGCDNQLGNVHQLREHLRDDDKAYVNMYEV